MYKNKKKNDIIQTKHKNTKKKMDLIMIFFLFAVPTE